MYVRQVYQSPASHKTMSGNKPSSRTLAASTVKKSKSRSRSRSRTFRRAATVKKTASRSRSRTRKSRSASRTRRTATGGSRSRSGAAAAASFCAPSSCRDQPVSLEAVKAALKRFKDRKTYAVDLITKFERTGTPKRTAVVLPAPARGCHAKHIKVTSEGKPYPTALKLGKTTGDYTGYADDLACLAKTTWNDTKIQDLASAGMDWWSAALTCKPSCADDSSALGVDRHTRELRQVEAFVKDHLYLKLPFLNKEYDVNVFGVFVPFSFESVQKTNGGETQYVSVKDDARPYVCIPKDFKDVLADHDKMLKAAQTSRTRSLARSAKSVSMKFLDKLDYSTPVPLLGEVFLQALEVERAVVEPALMLLKMKQDSEVAASTTTPSSALKSAFTRSNIIEVLGPLGAIVMYAVFGGPDNFKDSSPYALTDVYDTNLLSVIQRIYFDCVAIPNKRLQTLLGDDATVINDNTEQRHRRLYLKGAFCSSDPRPKIVVVKGGRRRRYDGGDLDNEEDDD